MQVGLYVTILYVCGAIAFVVAAFAYKSHLKTQAKRRRHYLRRVGKALN